MKTYLKIAVPWGIGLSLALVIGAAALSFRNLDEYRQNAEWVAHTHVVIERLETLRSEVLKVENARRGYVLTGDPQFATRLSAGRAEIEKTLGSLRTLTADNASQQKELEGLQALVQSRLDLLDRSLAIHRAGQPDDAEQSALTLPGAELTNRILTALDRMGNREQDLLRERSEQAQRSALKSRIALALAMFTTIALILAAFSLLRREVRERVRAEGELRDLATTLEQKVAERTSMLETHTKTLREQAALLDLAHDSIFVREMTNAIRFWNRGAEETYGWSREEALGKVTHTMLQTQFPEPLTKIEETLLAEGHWEGELIHTRRDGSCIVVDSRWALQQGADGIPTGVLELNRDITERKRSEDEIRSLNQALERRVAERTAELEAFTSSVAHDLRAPLRHVDGFSRILEEEYAPQLGIEGQKLVARVRRATQHMGELVDDLLNLSRVSRRELSPLVTDLNPLVREVINGLQPACQGRHVDFRVGLLPFAECDPGLMRQVFANLLGNAVKFTRPRDPAIIEVGQSDHNGNRAIFIRDNGVGFSMKYADKLFGVFQRFHRVEDFEGTGVGLATVLRIVQKHNGRIWAEAEVDRGAAFYFTLEGLEDRRSPESSRPAGGLHASG
ncbi:MAG TPA: CHASE3 domain-containing protein [Candidatus Acidoferrales bacterium]|nr:CHASE3 domain-containing protein [Candidatus Acidoferrales bacterium]